MSVVAYGVRCRFYHDKAAADGTMLSCVQRNNCEECDYFEGYVEENE